MKPTRDRHLQDYEPLALRPARPGYRNAYEAGQCGFDFEPYAKPEPTQHRPGSPGKFAELVQRLERGEELWHDEDYGMEKVRSTEQRSVPSDGAPDACKKDNAVRRNRLNRRRAAG